MAEEGMKGGVLSSGLASILSDGGQKGVKQKSHLISHFDDIGDQSVERTIEYILDLPHKSICRSPTPVDVGFIRSILKMRLRRLGMDWSMNNPDSDGVSIADSGFGSNTVYLNSASICGEIQSVRDPLLIESSAVFSSARANACVWKGKWMYEVTLETAGIQQLGWATDCSPFTDRKGVGDTDDSYAFDGRRVCKWNKISKAYGQSWVVGDVIGCCIDLDTDVISFYRNGVSLGMAFDEIRKMRPHIGYYPAISLSEGESCQLNFGSRPFKYPADGFHPIQASPCYGSSSFYLLQCLSRLLEVQRLDKSDSAYFEKLRRLKRFAPLEHLYCPISRGICEELFDIILPNEGSSEFIAWGVLSSFLLEIFGSQTPHDYSSLDQILGLLFEFNGHDSLFQHLIMALSFNCKTAPLVLVECPYSGSYPYLALACHMLRREEMMKLWWQSPNFEYGLEGFLSRKSPNKQDLELLMPSVWWPGSAEDIGSENSMVMATTALSSAITKIEELHRELCLIVVRFIPPTSPSQLPGSLFRTFLHNFILKVSGADRKMAPSDSSNNASLVSLYTVLLHFLSEGFAMDSIYCLLGSSTKAEGGEAFLHRGGKRNFPVGLFLNSDPHRNFIPRVGGSVNHLLKSHPVCDEKVVWWDEGCMDNDDDSWITHSTRQKPCCCFSTSDVGSFRTARDNVRYLARTSKGMFTPIPDRSFTAECTAGSLSNVIVGKPSSSDRSEEEFGCEPLQHMGNEPVACELTLDVLREEELLDVMLFLYHLGVTPKFRQAFYYMSHQSHSLSLLDDTDKQIRERSCIEQLRRLKEARKSYQEELVDCVRQCTWYRILLFSRWKQRGMYATCMWVAEMLLVLSNAGSLFLYVPEFYVESLVDCFHALRKSDPPYVSSAIFLKQGLASFITFVVKHFNDPRILSADIKDLLLQSISVLVQYTDYMLALESSKEALQNMPKALLLAFDNRSWIPVTNILLRIFKGSGFGSSVYAESSSSVIFQVLLREVCIYDEGLFFSFLNRLFNTLSWTMTEFSVSIRDMQESTQVGDLQQRKSAVVFDLSCNLARVLEFYTREIPQAFIQGPDVNLRRLTELVIFILNHVISVADTECFDNSLRRPVQCHEKSNRSMILAPLVGIILNLMDATLDPTYGEMNDIIDIFASMDCPLTVHSGFQYLLGYNWRKALGGDASLVKLAQLEKFSSYLRSRIAVSEGLEDSNVGPAEDDDDSRCCICYASDCNAQFQPCRHRSCFGCISRHLLNSERCFFCNATVTEVVHVAEKSSAVQL
ncbi:E3 ubiquitin-protein ligase RKP [Apostasia shenzhenica]|uniref:RING-type E3 ubiquitin transferase n=1 Tax=Apostasia shenzhenica TaxID=1088818 RepID=A0A2I0AMJ8_9ASPA|nr:E3 ubiquitin-protein ligase RKP [Apostasia shenzhenica]